MLLAAQKQHDATAKKMNQNGQFMKFYPPKQGVRYTIIELVEVGCQMYDIDILTRTPAYMIVKYKLNDPMKKKSKSSARAAGSRTTSSNSSRTTSSNSRQRRDDHNMHQSSSSVEIEEISVHSTTLSVIQPLANMHLNDVNNKAKHRYLRDDDYHVLHQLQRRGFSLAEYQSQNGTYEVDHLVAYFHESKMSTSFKFSKAERNALRQLLKYYETVTQEGYERGLDIYYLSCKRNVISAILKMNGELVREIKNNPYRQKGDDETSTQSSTGLSDMFKNQRLENKFKVVGACGSVLAKALTMKEAMKYIKEMGECMYCQGKMTMEPVSVFFFFFSCPVVVPLIYVLFYRCNLCFRNTCK